MVFERCIDALKLPLAYGKVLENGKQKTSDFTDLLY